MEGVVFFIFPVNLGLLKHCLVDLDDLLLKVLVDYVYLTHQRLLRLL